MSYKIFDGDYLSEEFDELGEATLFGQDDIEDTFDEYDSEEFGEDEEPEYATGDSPWSPTSEEDEWAEESLDDDDIVFHDNGIYEMKIRLTGKEKRKRDAMSQLMAALNKEPGYAAAKEKFVKVYKVLARKKIQELGLKIRPNTIDKVTIWDLNNK